jgi:hypothetical protein
VLSPLKAPLPPERPLASHDGPGFDGGTKPCQNRFLSSGAFGSKVLGRSPQDLNRVGEAVTQLTATQNRLQTVPWHRKRRSPGGGSTEQQIPSKPLCRVAVRLHACGVRRRLGLGLRRTCPDSVETAGLTRRAVSV